MTAQPILSSDKNYCARCSATGIPYGEPGEECCMCGNPLVLTDEQVARSRAVRRSLYEAKGRA